MSTVRVLDHSLSPSVLTAFSLPSYPPPLPLPGGQGTSYITSSRAYVLKYNPPPISAELYAIPQLFASLSPSPCFRIPTYIPSSIGDYILDNWTCTSFVEGETLPAGGPVESTTWEEIFKASRAFHYALKAAVNERPSWTEGRAHRWAVSDAIVWDEASMSDIEQRLPPSAMGFLSRLERLEQVLSSCEKNQAAESVSVPDEEIAYLVTPQLLHGDFANNILFASPASSLPPAIIDFSPYYRPLAYAEAIIASDGLVEFDADPTLVHLWLRVRGSSTGSGDEWMETQMLRMLVGRAMRFRILSDWLGEEEGRTIGNKEVAMWERALRIIENLVEEFLEK